MKIDYKYLIKGTIDNPEKKSGGMKKSMCGLIAVGVILGTFAIAAHKNITSVYKGDITAGTALEDSQGRERIRPDYPTIHGDLFNMYQQDNGSVVVTKSYDTSDGEKAAKLVIQDGKVIETNGIAPMNFEELYPIVHTAENLANGEVNDPFYLDGVLKYVKEAPGVNVSYNYVSGENGEAVFTTDVQFPPKAVAGGKNVTSIAYDGDGYVKVKSSYLSYGGVSEENIFIANDGVLVEATVTTNDIHDLDLPDTLGGKIAKAMVKTAQNLQNGANLEKATAEVCDLTAPESQKNIAAIKFAMTQYNR
ncbi:MAG: hypothetical protein GY804_06030 [Alphaproteobacteria bacterium]|nr:hypothetical protein [Alphaproteobacteria bacterium]